ncbi:MAG: DEAD/DEAH box helicase [Deltaproteobacteria bacterium]|jgi:non-specific serine/threonine protein kinase|nr:DEAD/DEAH box helicase [Deltaproteobacteria bacterium]
MDTLTLTPHGSLIFDERPGDWREMLFDLAAKRDQSGDAAINFWRRIAENMLFALCRLAENQPAEETTPPSENRLNLWVQGAPPMRGGEYLTPDMIRDIWQKMTAWVSGQSSGSKNLVQFLAKRASKWQRVGRVTFHLAENRTDSARPFAFMATYITGLSDSGKERYLPLHKALRQYAGEGDKSALLQLLTPVRKASEKLQWVARMSDDKSVYYPTPMSINQAHRFLMDVPVLEDCGLMVRIPDWWRRKPQVQVKVVVGENTIPRFGLHSLIDWRFNLSIGQETLTEEEIAEVLNTGEKLLFFKGQWLEVDPEKLQEALSFWSAAKAQSAGGGLSFIEAMRLLAGYPSNARGREAGDDEYGDEDEEESAWVKTEAGREMAELLKQLRDPQASGVPKELTATLRPYQEKGLTWLALVSGLGLGACLADDMGLGKTMQILALLLLDRRRTTEHQCSLLVAPASLLSNWKMEAKRFAPDLKVNVFHPSETSKEKLSFWEKHPEYMLKESDLLVTSYALLVRNLEFFSAQNFRLMIIDEAQAIKNPQTGQSKAVRKIKAQSRLALTGTPIENRLSDIWSLYDFLNPGLLGSAKKFKKTLELLEQREHDQYGPLRRLLAPYLLRRLKTDKSIISDLPDKTETTVQCWLSKAQAKIYGQIVEELKGSLKNFSDDQSDQFKRKGLVIRSLMRLKQLCNHPAQLTGDGDWSHERSGKFMRIAELVKEMADRQDKLLVFTQFQEIIEPLSGWLGQIFGRPGLVLHGGTPVRQRPGLVAEFQKDGGPPFFILSLKVGGTGLNLTAADQVIHFDRWWNPAVEDQATDRAYRIGQKKNVLVHKFVTRGTLEERIDAMLTDKRNLAEEVLGQGGEINLVNIDDQALLDLISLDISRAVI